MKTINRIAILVLYFTIVSTYQCVAQSSNNESKYTKGQLKWMMKHGFDYKSYDWSDKKINLNLDNALKERQTGNAAIVSSGIFGGLVFTTSILSALFHSSNPDRSPEVPSETKFFMGMAAISGGLSIVYKVKSARSFRKAKYYKFQYDKSR